ncbi:MAG: cell division protein FtsZ [Chitinophagales bacterium]|nr:cell division protein FtsZ [Chitinophagales bacterium]
MEFETKEESIIKVIGVGGGGSNAVNFMYEQGIDGVDFVICNTDRQALKTSVVTNTIALGPSLTGGRGAGAKPEVGKEATLESEDEIRNALGSHTQMIFVTAGMGGGTGTGGAPVVAKIAKDMGILTVGIVTMPFTFEGKTKLDKAKAGLNELSQYVDSLIVISNDKLREVFGNLSLTAAFSHADNILTTAAKGISEIITKPGYINVDFEDVRTVMVDSGVAIMGIGRAEGEGRAIKAIDAAISSPLLNDSDIYGARGILLYISSGRNEVTMDEVTSITEYVQNAASNDTELIWGVCKDESLNEEISITLIATGFQNKTENNSTRKPEKVFVTIDKEEPKRPEVKETVVTPVAEQFVVEEPSQSIELDLVEEEFSLLDRADEATTYEFETFERTIDEDEGEIVESTEQEFVFKITHRENTNDLDAVLNDHVKTQEDRANKNKEILNKRLKSGNYRDPKFIREMEEIPSFERKNKKFENVPHSSESHHSRITIYDSFEEENEGTLAFRENSHLNSKAD